MRYSLIETVFWIFRIHTVWQIFLFPIWKKIRKNRFIRKWQIIPQSSILKQDLVMLKMKKCLHFLKFHQKLTKQSDLVFFYFMHIWPSFGHLLLNRYKMFGLGLHKNFPTNYFLGWCIQREFKKTLGTLNKTPETFL